MSALALSMVPLARLAGVLELLPMAEGRLRCQETREKIHLLCFLVRANYKLGLCSTMGFVVAQLLGELRKNVGNETRLPRMRSGGDPSRQRVGILFQ